MRLFDRLVPIGYEDFSSSFMRDTFHLVGLLRHVLPALVVTVFWPGSAQADVAENARQVPVKDKWAVVVGVSEFANPSLNLKYAAKDASDFCRFLIDKCHFAPDHVKLLVNKDATKDKILDLLGDSWLPRVALPDDLVVIFISSHGSPSEMDVCGVNYIVAHDTKPEKLFTTGVPIQQLAGTIKERVHSNRVVVILDACHSGGASDSKGIQRTSNVDASQMAQGTGHVVICSSSKTESSWESKKYPNGVFTHTLIESLLKNGENTKLGEAFSQLKDSVQREVAAERGVIQTPVLETSKWKGQDLQLAAKPASPRPGLPEAVESTAEVTPPAAVAPPAPTTVSPAVPPAKSAVPDLSGDWIGSTGMRYRIWQNGRNCGWELPEYGEAAKGVVSEDGKSLASSWTGIVSGSGMAHLECDASGKAIRILCDNGVVLARVGSAYAAAMTLTFQAPDVAGLWRSSTGIDIELRQQGSRFGWTVPQYNEVGVANINSNGTVDCIWTGMYAGSCTARLQFNSAGRVVKMIGDNGMSLSRMGE